MSELEELLTPLTSKLADKFREEGLILLDLTIDKTINRPYSSVAFLKASTSGGNRRLVMKKIAHHPENIGITMSKNQAIVEHDTLDKLYKAFIDTPRCSVPKPVLVIPDYEAYVMDFVEGQLLGDHFGAAKYFASKKAFKDLKDSYYLCGLWLKKLHDFSGIRHAGKDAFDYTIERCHQRLEMIGGANHPDCPKGLEDKVKRFIDKQLGLVREDDVLITGRHGDFGSWNILVNSDGITVFDFLGYNDDLLPIDLLKMLTTFEIEKKYLFFNAKKINSLKQAFLHGYGGLPRVSEPISAICEALHRVCSLSGAVTNNTGNIFRHIERYRAIKQNVSWLLADHKSLLWEEAIQTYNSYIHQPFNAK